MAKYFLLDLDSINTQYLENSILHCFHPGVSLHDSPVAALEWAICDFSTVEKIESGNLPKVLRTSGVDHIVEGYYRVQTEVAQVTGEIETFVNFYAVCKW